MLIFCFKISKCLSKCFFILFFHPKIGLWLGAFSEQLVKIEDSVFKTMSVAGTQLYQEGKEIVWENKEKQEQQYVTDFILDNLKSIVSRISVSKPYTLRAGGIVHIKTDIEGELKQEFGLKNILSVLHPTPAVCGFPKEAAKDFILKMKGMIEHFIRVFRRNE